ncbi:MAG: hypothetical protein NTW68_10800 [candidate division NC10 bacterium]|nr:hypothetical protein [candidate division NC10 bacterium]
MPCQPRLDAPETLHHVMVRGLERRVIFKVDVLGRRASALARAWRQTRGNVTWAARWQTEIPDWCR